VYWLSLPLRITIKWAFFFFSDVVEKFIPPKKGKSHIMRIISEIYDFHPSQTGTNISEALKYFNNVVKKKMHRVPHL
jgi:uncharacterized protein (DUF58 family)